MNDRPMPEYRVLLTVDLEDYSSRNDSEQRALQSALGNAIDHAADAAELDRQSWLRQLGGDGIFAILPAGTDMSRLMDTFIRELDARLGSYNRRRAGDAWSRMRLRMAVHIGPVHVDGATGWPGQHVVQPARLRDSDPVRTAMSAQPGADLAVIVSAEVFRDYITQGPESHGPMNSARYKSRSRSRTTRHISTSPATTPTNWETWPSSTPPSAHPTRAGRSRRKTGRQPPPRAPAAT